MRQQRISTSSLRSALCQVLLALGGLAPTWAWSYERHDLLQLVQTVQAENRPQHQLNLRLIDQILADLSRHAANYPVHFTSAAERQLAVGEAQKLSDMLNVLDPSPRTAPDMLWRIARLNAMAYNLDVKAAGPRAESAYKLLLRQNPAHPGANYGYGLFLASSARAQASIPYLETADRLGIDSAAYTLGLVKLSTNDRTGALVLLRQYAKRHPQDTTVQKIIEQANHTSTELK